MNEMMMEGFHHPSIICIVRYKIIKGEMSCQNTTGARPEKLP